MDNSYNQAAARRHRVARNLARAILVLLFLFTLGVIGSSVWAMVNSQGGIDIAVDKVSVPSGPVTLGDTVTLTVSVGNSSGTAAASVEVVLNVLPSGGAPANIGMKNVSVGANSSTDVSFDWDTAGVPVGSYTFQAVALLDGSGNDADPSNNFKVTTTPLAVSSPPARDVAVTAVSFPSGPVEEGDLVDVQVVVQNKGTEAVSVTLSVVDTLGRTGIAEKEIETLSAGRSVTETVPWDTTGATGGNYRVQASATVEGEETDQLADNSLVSESSIAIVSFRFPLGNENGNNLPQASLHRKLTSVSVETSAEPIGEIVTFGGGALASPALSPPVITTSPASLQALFTANSQAALGSRSSLQNPFELGHIRGVIQLEEQDSSIGAHVIVGGRTFFAQEDGAFDATVPMGDYDMEVRAPGYVPVRVTGIRLGIGGEVNIPEFTLPFGDANGDGRIDILDLSIAAGNFGATIEELPQP